MRLLHCVRSLNPVGGGPIEAIRQRVCALSIRGVESEVACLDEATKPWLADFPVAVHGLGPCFGGYGYSTRWIPWLRRNCGRFDAVIINGLWQFNSLGTKVGLPRNFPYFVFPHGMLDPWFKRTYPLKHVKKWLYWPWAEYRVLRGARAVFFTSEAERRLARESFWLYCCRECVVNYGTADPSGELKASKQKFLDAFPKVRGERFLLYLGRLHEKKGLDLLCDAWARERPDRLLLIAGPGEPAFIRALERRIEHLGISASVLLVGMLSGALKWGALAAADAFVLPSHQENFGVAVAEALACETPVLISDQVNIWREIVEDGAGVAASDDIEGTCSLLRSWITSSAGAWNERRSRARQCFERRFTIAKSAESLIRAIERYGVRAASRAVQ